MTWDASTRLPAVFLDPAYPCNREPEFQICKDRDAYPPASPWPSVDDGRTLHSRITRTCKVR
jgi:hypothetical protein